MAANTNSRSSCDGKQREVVKYGRAQVIGNQGEHENALCSRPRRHDVCRQSPTAADPNHENADERRQADEAGFRQHA